MTTRLRATMQTWTTPVPAAGVGVLKWKVDSVEPVSIDPVEVSTPLGVHPELPETVTLRYADGGSLQAGVWWRPISEEPLDPDRRIGLMRWLGSENLDR
ncbi:MAG: Ig-like domain-containing protein [Dactylosporangium sp.]|nr:Ig-like domain-containing protein [Dactylosporangium sp.]